MQCICSTLKHKSTIPACSTSQSSSALGSGYNLESNPITVDHVNRSSNTSRYRSDYDTRLCFQHSYLPFRPLPYLTWPITCRSSTGLNDPTLPRLPQPFCPFRSRAQDSLYELVTALLRPELPVALSTVHPRSSLQAPKPPLPAVGLTLPPQSPNWLGPRPTGHMQSPLVFVSTSKLESATSRKLSLVFREAGRWLLCWTELVLVADKWGQH